MLEEYREENWHYIWWAVPAMLIACVGAGVALYFGLGLLAPKADDIFDACMARAERGGLSEAVRDEAVLICLEKAG